SALPSSVYRLLLPRRGRLGVAADFHGLGAVRCSADVAPPVATVPRPRGAVLAPKGPRAVATGGAAARRSPPTRNPWKRVSLFFLLRRAAGRCSMPGTYSQLLLHVVFSTRSRTPWIATEVAERLNPYTGRMIRREEA